MRLNREKRKIEHLKACKINQLKIVSTQDTNLSCDPWGHCQMLNPLQDQNLSEKSDATRMAIAERLGEYFSDEKIAEADLRAAEALARELANDAVERVRSALSTALATAVYLPRDIVQTIAHDVDSIAGPFLQITDVLSDEEWRDLVVTLSTGVRRAVAARSSMPESLAIALSSYGDESVVEILIDNPATPMTEGVCRPIVDRFQSDTGILDRLAQRDDLVNSVVITLITRVSAAALDKLTNTYRMGEDARPVVIKAENTALLGLIEDTPGSDWPNLVRSLQSQGKLTYPVMLSALEENYFAFFHAAVCVLGEVSPRQTGRILLHGDFWAVSGIFDQCRIPAEMRDQFWDALSQARTRALEMKKN